MPPPGRRNRKVLLGLGVKVNCPAVPERRRGDRMRRREFIGFLSAAAAGPRDAWAQQPSGKMARIGYLMERAGRLEIDDAFLSGLRELGYSEGRNLTMEYRWAGGGERLPALAADLVAQKVDLIVTHGAAAPLAAQNDAATQPNALAR